MKKTFAFLAIIVVAMSCTSGKAVSGKKNGWIELFDGKSLNGWKVGGNESSIFADSGMIIINGPVAHLYYDGEVEEHNFKNFELKAEIMTKPGSNSGVYFHSRYQPKGFPDNGYEVQVNNTHKDWKKTGSLYDIKEVKEVYVNDDEWFTLYIKVVGKHITIKINDKEVLDYIEPEGYKPAPNHPGRIIGSGTFALQAHDPKSKVYYRSIKVKPLK